MTYCCEYLSIADCLYIEPMMPLDNTTVGKHNLNFTLDFHRWGGISTSCIGVFMYFPCEKLIRSSIADWWRCSSCSIWRQSTSRLFVTTSSLTVTISLWRYGEACHVSFCSKREIVLAGLLYTVSGDVFWRVLGTADWSPVVPGLLCHGFVYPVNNARCDCGRLSYECSWCGPEALAWLTAFCALMHLKYNKTINLFREMLLGKAVFRS